jgi:preprotein translocase subunit SecF
MEFFRIKKDIPFMRHALKFNIISLVTFLLAVVFLFSKGLHLSVEFTGGTLIEVNYQQAADLEKSAARSASPASPITRCRTSARRRT